MISAVIEHMMVFYGGNYHDISHSLNVWALAKAIGEQEGLDDKTQEILELEVLSHDLACPLCREKYGNTNGKKQELESPPILRKFFDQFSLPEEDLNRIVQVVSVHHTYEPVLGTDHQILLEADYLVNAAEGKRPVSAILSIGEKIIRTETGKRFLHAMFPVAN